MKPVIGDNFQLGKKQTPNDINKLAASIVEQATDELEEPPKEKNPHAVALCRPGGLGRVRSQTSLIVYVESE